MARTWTRSVSLAFAAVALLCVAFLFASATKSSAYWWSPPSYSCGNQLRKSTGGYWKCTWSDDFSGSTISTSRWAAQRTDLTGFGDGSALGRSCFVDSQNNISVSNGSLSLTSRQEAPFTCKSPYGDFATPYTSGMVSTAGRFAQTYGRFEIRARTWSTKLPGLQTTLWLWPANATKFGPWPASGEIDIAEMFSAHADRAIPFVHYVPAAADPNVTNNNCMIPDLSAWHTYAVEWTSSSIKFIYDGVTCLVDNWNPALPLLKPEPFNQPFIIALSQGLGRDFDPAVTQLPATTQIDYVRVWK